MIGYLSNTLSSLSLKYIEGQTFLNDVFNNVARSLKNTYMKMNYGDLDALLENGNTPLVDAIEKADNKRIKDLVEKNVDLDKPERQGITPLMRVVYQFNTCDVIDLLLEKGANPDIQGHSGMTALMHAVFVQACSRSSLPIIETLLKKGANPDIQKKEGVTPLMYAVQLGDPKTVRLLREYGADLNIEDDKALKAIDYIKGIDKQPLVPARSLILMQEIRTALATQPKTEWPDQRVLNKMALAA